MNKRQRKKREKIINERYKFFSKMFINICRRNGKTQLLAVINKAIYSKKYKPFNELRKMYENKIITIDWSNRKDYSVQTTTKINGDKIEILNVEIIE